MQQTASISDTRIAIKQQLPKKHGMEYITFQLITSSRDYKTKICDKLKSKEKKLNNHQNQIELEIL